MRFFAIICAVAIAASFIPDRSSAEVRINCDRKCGGMFRGHDVDVNLNNGSIRYTNNDNDETVEITENYELLVNGDEVRLRSDQKRLVQDYYECFGDVVTCAKEIGVESVRVGIRGAAKGITAVITALSRLGDGCGSERAERTLEMKLGHEGDKLDAATAKLERKADRLERRAERLEKLHKKLRHEIGALDDLGWF